MLRFTCPPRRILLPAVMILLFCGATHAQSYWFESYQRAVKLIDDSRYDEAALLLDDVIRDRPMPQAALRIPGHQYLDYLPYFQRARIEIHRGQFDRAAHSLDVSEAFGAVRASRRPEVEFNRMRGLVVSAQAAAGVRLPDLASTTRVAP